MLFASAVDTVAARCSGLPADVTGATWDTRCSNSSVPGDVCSVLCGNGVGSVTSTCLQTGAWSTVAGTCSTTPPGMYVVAHGLLVHIGVHSSVIYHTASASSVDLLMAAHNNLTSVFYIEHVVVLVDVKH